MSPTPPAEGALRALVEPLGALGPRAWAVGGGVRDALLGRGVADLDVAVDGDAAAAASALARPAGATRFRLSRAFGAWRRPGRPAALRRSTSRPSRAGASRRTSPAAT